jgi:hypothetical protein
MVSPSLIVNSVTLLISPVLIYPASEAPNYQVGYKAAAAFCVACLIATGAFKYQDRRLRQQQSRLRQMDTN